MVISNASATHEDADAVDLAFVVLELADDGDGRSFLVVPAAVSWNPLPPARGLTLHFAVRMFVAMRSLEGDIDADISRIILSEDILNMSKERPV